LIIIKYGEERFSPLHVALILALKRGPMKTSQLLKFMRSLGFHARSSFYAALSELERRGYISRERMPGATVSCTLTRKGAIAAAELPRILKDRIEPMLRYISLIAQVCEPMLDFKGMSIAEELEDLDDMLSYREFLVRELNIIERKLKRWKKIEIE